MNVYLDYAAATPVDTDVTAVMQPFYTDQFYNPSALYQPALTVRALLDDARSEVAQQLGLRPAEIIFTAGGTEANNLAVLGVLREYPGKNIVYTSLEHDSVRHPAHYMKENGWGAVEVQPTSQGLMDVQSIIDAVTDETVLVSVMYANNEVGTIQPIKKIAAALEIIRKNRRASDNSLPLYFHTDACQAVNYLDINMHRLGVDMMTLNGGKIYGPKQSGILAVTSHVRMQPLLFGGGQELNRRSGTENVAFAAGFARALSKTARLRTDETKRLISLRDWFLEELTTSNPNIIVNGSRKHRLPNNVHITIPGTDNERALFALDDQGIQVAAGSACSASKEESSHVLRSMGLSDDDARASLRLTFGRQTSRQQLTYVLERFKHLFS